MRHLPAPWGGAGRCTTPLVAHAEELRVLCGNRQLVHVLGGAGSCTHSRGCWDLLKLLLLLAPKGAGSCCHAELLAPPTPSLPAACPQGIPVCAPTAQRSPGSSHPPRLHVPERGLQVIPPRPQHHQLAPLPHHPFVVVTDEVDALRVRHTGMEVGTEVGTEPPAVVCPKLSSTGPLPSSCVHSNRVSM